MAPMVIEVGGAAGAMGSGLGEGIQQGYADHKKAQADAQFAEDANKLTTAAWRSEVEKQEREKKFAAGADKQNVAPGTATFIGGKIPMYLNPGPDPDELEFDTLVQKHEGAMDAIANPAQRLSYAEIAMEDLGKLRGALDGRKLQREIQSAVASEHLSEEEALGLMSRLEDEDVSPTEVYQEWRKLRDEKKATVVRRGKVREAGLKAASMIEEIDRLTQQASDSVWRQHYEDVKGQMSAYIEGERFDIETDPDGWDASGAIEHLTALKNQPNAYQAAEFNRLQEEQAQIVKEAMIVQEQNFKLQLAEANNRSDEYVAKMNSLYGALRAAIAAMDEAEIVAIQAKIDNLSPPVDGAPVAGLQQPGAAPPAAPGAPDVAPPADPGTAPPAAPGAPDVAPPADPGTAPPAAPGQPIDSSGLDMFGRDLNSDAVGTREEGEQRLSNILKQMGWDGQTSELEWLRSIPREVAEKIIGARMVVRKLPKANPAKIGGLTDELPALDLPALDPDIAAKEQLDRLKQEVKELQLNGMSNEQIVDTLARAGHDPDYVRQILGIEPMAQPHPLQQAIDQQGVANFQDPHLGDTRPGGTARKLPRKK